MIAGWLEHYQYWHREMNISWEISKIYKSSLISKLKELIVKSCLWEFIRHCSIFTGRRDYMCSDSLRISSGDMWLLMIDCLAINHLINHIMLLVLISMNYGFHSLKKHMLNCMDVIKHWYLDILMMLLMKWLVWFQIRLNYIIKIWNSLIRISRVLMYFGSS